MIEFLKILETANRNMFKLFPEKHVEITLDDVLKVYSRNLLSIEVDAKTRKGTSKGYLTGILYLAPAKLSGVEACPSRSLGCSEACLFTAGRGVMYPVFLARVLRSLAMHLDRPRFIQCLKRDLKRLKNKALRKDMVPVGRLNGTSDLLWDRNTNIMQEFSDVQFYDYTKIIQRTYFRLPENYHLTVSYSETMETSTIRQLVEQGNNVAMVFDVIPSEYLGLTVINGDDTDLRFLDKKGVIVGLTAKGRAKKDVSGFVIRTQTQNKKVA